MNVQSKGMTNPLLALQQKKVAQQKQASPTVKLLDQPQTDTFQKKAPQFGASCCR
jgi:hypothetical protein